jgi:hypothetical protein
VTNLERLNQLLATIPGLPEFRRTVSPSLSNLKWLQDKMPKNKDCPQELLDLLKLGPKELHSQQKVAA